MLEGSGEEEEEEWGWGGKEGEFEGSGWKGSVREKAKIEIGKETKLTTIQEFSLCRSRCFNEHVSGLGREDEEFDEHRTAYVPHTSMLFSTLHIRLSSQTSPYCCKVCNELM